jgi:hypothetical protein
MPFAARGAELHGFATKSFQTVENDHENRVKKFLCWGAPERAIKVLIS